MNRQTIAELEKIKSDKKVDVLLQVLRNLMFKYPNMLPPILDEIKLMDIDYKKYLEIKSTADGNH